MLERFADDAELLVDVLGEPIVGVGAIRSAYLDRPPDDEIVLLDAWETAAGASGTYAWSQEPDVAAGELRLTVVGGRIVRLVVTAS